MKTELSVEQAGLHAGRMPVWGRSLGMGLLIASLAILFVGGWLAWLLIRFQLVEHGLPLHQMVVPSLLWVSTLLVLASGATLHISYRRREQFAASRIWLHACSALILAFVICQCVGVYQLLNSHATAMEGLEAAEYAHGLYGFTGVIVTIHALHVMGGLFPLVWMYLPNRHVGKRVPDGLLVSYWHFLEIVWVWLMISFVLVG